MANFRYQDFVEQLGRRVPIRDRDEVDRAIAAALAALATQLPGLDRDFIADGLPPPMNRAWRHATPGPRGLDSLHDAVTAQVGGDRAEGVELAHAIARLLGERLEPEARAHLRRHLPAQVAAVVEADDYDRAAPPGRMAPSPPPGQGHTLATGRPDSRHPLSAAAPERAQADSVARRDDPHGGIKLSTGHADGDTLAAVRPAHGRSIAERRD